MEEQKISQSAESLERTSSDAPRSRAELPISAEKFVALTAHEMQIPITTLSWNLERLTKVLGEAAENKDVEKVLLRLREANVRLVTLVEDLLNLAKLHEGAFVVAKRPMQLAEIVRRALRGAAHTVLERGITLTWHMEPGKVPLILGDPDRLNQVIENLVSNAIKYTPRGGSVRVSLRRTEDIAPATIARVRPAAPQTDGYVLCMVEDTGIGIPADEQPRLFQQFFRGRKAVASREGGTGLGLFLVKTIIEQHGGAIWFTSREGHGTTFFFTIPVVRPYEQHTTSDSHH